MQSETSDTAAAPSDIPIHWQGDFLFVGKVCIGFVGYDLRKTPEHFAAHIGTDGNIIGWFATREEARRETVRYIMEGPHVPF